MNILIVSRSPWSVDNSFGNTFSNLFNQMEDVNIYHVCCQDGKTEQSLAKATFQMTDSSVAKSVFGKKPGWVVKEETIPVEDAAEQKIKHKKWKRLTVLFAIRDLIWKVGRWKQSSDLKAFLDMAKPDVLYLPIYSSIYMCDVQEYIIEYLKVPTVGHISDDVYTYPSGYFASPLVLAYRFFLRRKLRKIIGSASYLEVFAHNMQEEYERIFDKKCYLIGKGIDGMSLRQLKDSSAAEHQFKTFLFTGNLGDARWKVLCDIAKTLEQRADGSALNVYSATALSNDMQKAFDKCSCLHFMGRISFGEVQQKQREADVLVHVESFSPKSVFLSRMSFSTKIIDYMLAGKPILAVGPHRVNSIGFLAKYHLAFVADCVQNIPMAISAMNNEEEIRSVQKNVREYLQAERNIDKIQAGMLERMRAVSGNSKN